VSWRRSRPPSRLPRTYEGAAAEIGIYPRRAHIDAGGDARPDEIVVELVRLESGSADDHLTVIDQRGGPHQEPDVGLAVAAREQRGGIERLDDLVPHDLASRLIDVGRLPRQSARISITGTDNCCAPAAIAPRSRALR
jgi:hypothetical protein